MSLPQELRQAAQDSAHGDLLIRAAEAIQSKDRALTALIKYSERQTCSHDETYRGGAIWEICSMCGKKWADDKGSKPEWVEPIQITEARAALSAQGEKK